jgi:hypothetical protein
VGGLKLMFSQYSKFPFHLRVGVLEELEHKVDSIIVVADAMNEQTFLQGDELVQTIKRLGELRGKQPKSEQER